MARHEGQQHSRSSPYLSHEEVCLTASGQDFAQVAAMKELRLALVAAPIHIRLHGLELAVSIIYYDVLYYIIISFNMFQYTIMYYNFWVGSVMDTSYCPHFLGHVPKQVSRRPIPPQKRTLNPNPKP